MRPTHAETDERLLHSWLDSLTPSRMRRNFETSARRPQRPKVLDSDSALSPAEAMRRVARALPHQRTATRLPFGSANHHHSIGRRVHQPRDDADIADISEIAPINRLTPAAARSSPAKMRIIALDLVDDKVVKSALA